MFSPGTKRPSAAVGSPATPLAENRRDSADTVVPHRPATGTPAPWAPRLSVLARIPTAKKNEKEDGADPVKPVYVGEFPQVVRDEQTKLLQRRVPGDAYVSGGVEKGSSVAWIICGSRLFIWSYLSPSASVKCVVLDVPSNVLEKEDIGRNDGNCWMLCAVNWDRTSNRTKKTVEHHNYAAVVLCNQKTRAVVYWPDIYSEAKTTPVTSISSSDELEVVSSPNTLNRQQQSSRHRSGFSVLFNSLIASAIPDSQRTCVALASTSNGELWKFLCSPSGIKSQKVNWGSSSSTSQGGDSDQVTGSKGYPRSLIWRFSHPSVLESKREFFLLTNHEIQCLTVDLSRGTNVSKIWSHEIIGTDSDLGIKKDLAGQKHIWPLDVQVDSHGKVITILVAIFCKDRVSSSSYTQYSLLTMQYKSGVGAEIANERVLEKKAPIQVIIPKARVEDEDFLFSMRLRVGGKPSGSAVILSNDGTATVSHYYRGSTRLYQFDLPYDAGKVLDASVLPSTDDGEEGAWIVLTEKAGIWAIPEKAVIIGGVDPPERSLSRKGSSNERSAQGERKNLTFGESMVPRRVSSEAQAPMDGQKGFMGVNARRSTHDDESETLLGQLFHEFQLSGQVEGPLEKLQKTRAFERDEETNVFARMSKAIADTLAKHWTTTRGAEILAMAVVSSQLMDKQQKHHKFLQFLALSKCHEELCSRQRHALQAIMEHGEKLAGMIQLRELQNVTRSAGVGSSHSNQEIQASGALWDLIQLVGERARRSTVLLMDRDNAEVFYSKVSDLDEMFYCLDKQLDYIISTEQQFGVQTQRACELSNACVTVIRTAMQYKNEHHLWYPPPEGITPWYCKPVVRNGMWRVASFMLHLLKEASVLEVSAKSDVYTHLEPLAEVILETYTGAITAKVEFGEDHKGLLDEYWSRRDLLLHSLYQQVKEFVETELQSFQGLSGETDETQKEMLKKYSSTLLSIAKRHECYSTLWEICWDLNESDLLRNLMHESMGPNGGFSYFVFKQLYASRQFSKLLRLGEEFPEELSIFLKRHQDLLWLHELFLHQFSSASETLHSLALAQPESSKSEAESAMDPNYANMVPKLQDRKRLLNLSKIAAIAGKGDGANVKRVEADLKILRLQEEIAKLVPNDGTKRPVSERLLNPEELIKLCLESGSPELSLCAFDVFKWTSSSFRGAHKKLLEECWKNAADQEDWGELCRASTIEGWTDEETLQNLRHTALFKAASQCYGPMAETFGDGFDRVLPLRDEASGPSVEAILMMHKDYPDAGKLMLTAIMLGSLDDGVGDNEEGSTAME